MYQFVEVVFLVLIWFGLALKDLGYNTLPNVEF